MPLRTNHTARACDSLLVNESSTSDLSEDTALLCAQHMIDASACAAITRSYQWMHSVKRRAIIIMTAVSFRNDLPVHAGHGQYDSEHCKARGCCWAVQGACAYHNHQRPLFSLLLPVLHLAERAPPTGIGVCLDGGQPWGQPQRISHQQSTPVLASYCSRHWMHG